MAVIAIFFAGRFFADDFGFCFFVTTRDSTFACSFCAGLLLSAKFRCKKAGRLALATLRRSLGIGLFGWLIFTLAVYALPFFVGLTVGMAAFNGGAGVVGALLVGIVAGALTLATGQLAFAVVRPLILRAAIAVAFAVPAAIAGYHAVLGLSQIGVPSLIWREVFAWVGAIFIGGTAWARMSVFAEPLPLKPGEAAPNEPQPVLAAATRKRSKAFASPIKVHRESGVDESRPEVKRPEGLGPLRNARSPSCRTFGGPRTCGQALGRDHASANDAVSFCAMASISAPELADILRSKTGIRHVFP